MALRLNAGDIVRCRFPEDPAFGDPTKPDQNFHRVVVVRTFHEFDGTQHAQVVFGSGQRTTQKTGKPCAPNEFEIDAEAGTGLTTQTRFDFYKNAVLKVEAPWFPADMNLLSRGRVPRDRSMDFDSLIKTFYPAPTPDSPKANAVVPTPVKIVVKKKLTLHPTGLPQDRAPGSES